MAKGKPTYDGVSALKATLENHRSHALERWKKAELFYNLEFDVRRRKGVEMVRTAEARGIIDHFVDNVVALNAKVTRVRVSDKKASQSRDDLVEQWGAAVIEALNRYSFIPPFKGLAKNIAMFGMGVGFGPVWNLDAGEGEFPFIFKALHPAHVLFVPGQGRSLKEVLQVGQRSNAELRAEYPEFEGEGKESDLVETIVSWDDKWHGLWAGSKEIFIKEHELGFLPHILSLSGLGQERIEVRDSLLLDQAIGLLDFRQDSLRANAQIMTAITDGIDQTVNRQMGTKLDAKELSDQMVPGAAIVGGLQDKESVWYFDPLQMPNWIFQAMNIFRADSMPYVGTLAGEHQPGVDTYAAQAALMAQAQLMFAVMMAQLNHTAEIFLGNCARLTVGRGEPMSIVGTVGGEKRLITIKPEDFEENYELRVDFEAANDITRERQMMTWSRLEKEGQISKETLWEEGLSLPNASQEDVRLGVQNLLLSPKVLEAMEQAAVEEFEMQRAEEQGMPGAAPVPPLPVPMQPPVPQPVVAPQPIAAPQAIMTPAGPVIPPPQGAISQA